MLIAGDGITTMTSASASSAPAQLPQADQAQDSGDKGGEMSVDDVPSYPLQAREVPKPGNFLKLLQGTTPRTPQPTGWSEAECYYSCKYLSKT